MTTKVVYPKFIDISRLNHVAPSYYSLWRRFLIWTCKMYTPIRNRFGLSPDWWGTNNECASEQPMTHSDDEHGFTMQAWWSKCKNCGGWSTGNVKPFVVPARSEWASTGWYKCLDCDFGTDDAAEMLAHSERKCAEYWPEII